MEKSLTVMIVDDDADDIELFCEAVKEINNTILCITAASGADAIKMLDGIPASPDFIFLDLNMPKMSGRQCLVQLRTLKHLQDTPIIIYTTSRVRDDIQEMKVLGATCFLTKPSKLSVLKQVLQAALQKNWNRIESLSL